MGESKSSVSNHELLKNYRHSFLLIALLAMVIIQPYFVRSAMGIFVSDLMFTLVIMASTFDLGLKEKRWKLSLIIALPVLGCMWTLQAFDQTQNYEAIIHWLMLRNLMMVIFLCYISLKIAAEVFNSTKVSQEEISGGITVYILLGVIWAYLYTTVILYDHDAIHFPEVVHAEAEITNKVLEDQAYQQVGSLHYFSFVTLTTLGYGDITPRSTTAQTLAWLEACAGQMFITVMMARLVGLRVAQMLKKDIEEEYNEDT